MFPDLFIIRLLLRLGILCLDLIAPLCILYSLLTFYLYPTPPLILFFPLSISHEQFYTFLQLYTTTESTWYFLHLIGRNLVAKGWWDWRGQLEPTSSEERWRLWVAMLESSKDPWDWLGGFFTVPGVKRAPRGIEDPVITRVKLQDLGRSNVEEFVASAMFSRSLSSIKPKSLERAELNSMILLLEAAINNAHSNVGFKFGRGRSRHHVFNVSTEPLVTHHHPLIFYFLIATLSHLGSFTLFFAGFRYYGPTTSWPFPLLFMRGSKKALDRLQDPVEVEKMGSSFHADKVGYWSHPGSKQAQEDGLTPAVFFHGISGTYGPTPFIIFLQRLTGRPFFVLEFPYVTMRLAPPSAILTRIETVAAVRRMLWRHGFGLTNDEDGEDDDGSSTSSSEVEEEEGERRRIGGGGEEEEWRRGRAVLVAHSLGSGPAGWVLRDAPDIVAGTILIDPMSFLLFSASGPRNFFRTKCRTAGEIFFRYFACERGIGHFLSRHLRWTDSVIFGSKPVAPLPSGTRTLIPPFARVPLEPPFDKPNYAQYVSPCPEGPFPTIVFLSLNDCILPIPKITTYLVSTGFSVQDETLRLMDLDHAAVLFRPYWVKQVAKAIDRVAEAGDRLQWEEED